MRNKLFIIFLIVGMLFLLPQASLMAAERVITLKVATYQPAPTPSSKALAEFNADLELLSGGRVKVQFFPGGSLANGPAMIKAIENGITDIGLSHNAYTPGRFPVTEVLEMPHGFATGWIANLVMNDFYDRFKSKEWDSVHPLWFHANTPAVLASTKPLKTLDDFKGQIIRAPGWQADIITALGGTPAPTPIVETYDAIAKNVIQGVFVGGEGIAAFRFGEVVKYITNSYNVGSSYCFYVAMNKRSYDRLPADIQKIIDYLAGAYRQKFALAWNAADFRGEAFAKEKGVEFYELPQAEFDRWIKAVQPVFDKYTAEMTKKGFSKEEIQSWIDFINKRKNELLDQQIALHIKSTTGPPPVRE